MSPRPPGWLANVALATASLLLVLLVIEVALRLGGFAPERHIATRRIVDARWTTLLDCYPTNPRGYFAINLHEPENHERFFHIAPRRFDAILIAVTHSETLAAAMMQRRELIDGQLQ